MPPASAAWRIRCASALLTASGFSIITWMRRCAAASTIDGMVAGVRERRDGLGLDRVEHRTEIGEERRVGELVAFRVASQERRVGLEDADDLHVRAPLRGAQEAAHVSVHEARNRKAERWPFLSSYTRQGSDDGGDEHRSKPGAGHGGCLHLDALCDFH